MGYGLRALDAVPASSEIFRFPTEQCIAGTNFRELQNADEERLYEDTHAVSQIFFGNDLAQLQRLKQQLLTTVKLASVAHGNLEEYSDFQAAFPQQEM